MSLYDGIGLNLDSKQETGLHGFRQDGRLCDELRKINCKLGILPQADGSAVFEIGNTKVLAAVYGPREPASNLRHKVPHDRALLNCVFSMATFSTTERKKRPTGDKRSQSFSINLKQAFDSAGWQQSSSIKLLQSQLVAKKASLQQRAKRAIPNSSSQLTTTQSVNVSHEASAPRNGESNTTAVHQDAQELPVSGTSLPITTPTSGGPGAFSFAAGVPALEEYDPFKPNDYEESKKRQQALQFQQPRTRKHEDDDDSPSNRRHHSRSPKDNDSVGPTSSKVPRAMSPLATSQNSSPSRNNQPPSTAVTGGASTINDSTPIVNSFLGANKLSLGFAGKYSDSEDEEFEPEKNKKSASVDNDPSRKGAAIAPPQEQLQAQEKIIAANPIVASAVPDRPYAKIFHKTDSSLQMGTSVAVNIMKKFGYKEGTGLGKSGQGIATALSVEKTSKRGGKIINADSEVREAARREQEEQESIAEMMKRPSKVILLKNMVGAGEVDEDLEPETAEECSKYGDVMKVVIFEMPKTPDASSDDAVRIFVQFKRMESAIKAIVDLNGRWFGGRQVRAAFYDMERFETMELRD